MNDIRIERIYGGDVKVAIDEFYKKNGSNGTARKEDLFFIAYFDKQIVGCVRFCLEENTPLLRTMYVDSTCRQKGVGKQLLKAFEQYLDTHNFRNVFCLPYTHLEKFYGLINFKVVEKNAVPKFLLERATDYSQNGTHTLFMRRL